VYVDEGLSQHVLTQLHTEPRQVGVWSQGSSLRVERSTFAGEVALWHHAGTGVISDSVLVARQPTASAAGLRVADLPSASSLLTAINVTVANDSPGTGSRFCARISISRRSPR